MVGHPLYCIRRIEPSPSGIGAHWSVRMTRGKVSFQANFHDSPFQGMQRALLAAQAYRDALSACLAPIKVIKTRTKSLKDGGMQGVSRYIIKGIAYWTASVRVDKKPSLLNSR